MTRPLLKWHGGKTRQMSELLRVFPDLSRMRLYVEPFLGGGSVFLRAWELSGGKCEQYLLSDTNAALVNCYSQVHDRIEEVISEIRRLRPGAYYAVRDEFNAGRLEETPRRAAQMTWLINSCFGGGWRENATGEFNFSRGWEWRGDRQEAFFDNMRAWSELLRDPRVSIRCLDFGDALEKQASLGGRDFAYFDPPYLTGAYSPGFGREDHLRLAAWCRRLRDQHVRWVLSNAGKPADMDELYGCFQRRAYAVQRTCGCEYYKMNWEREYVVWNY